jgi:hypothetical protein
LAKASPKKTENSGFIFRPWITLPNGTVLVAKHYGLRAFKIPVADNDNPPKSKD